MPIYAYRCESCGHAMDVLQKMSDPVLTQCPSCAAPTFRKQVTAAGFQLKGSGWYATDFKGSGAKPAASTPDAPAAGADGAPAPAPAPGDSGGGSGGAAAPAASAAAPSASTAGGCGTGCGSH